MILRLGTTDLVWSHTLRQHAHLVALLLYLAREQITSCSCAWFLQKPACWSWPLSSHPNYRRGHADKVADNILQCVCHAGNHAAFKAKPTQTLSPLAHQRACGYYPPSLSCLFELFMYGWKERSGEYNIVCWRPLNLHNKRDPRHLCRSAEKAQRVKPTSVRTVAATESTVKARRVAREKLETSADLGKHTSCCTSLHRLQTYT